eukprot:364604-Chlamydomonas_euryale.AAC.12
MHAAQILIVHAALTSPCMQLNISPSMPQNPPSCVQVAPPPGSVCCSAPSPACSTAPPRMLEAHAAACTHDALVHVLQPELVQHVAVGVKVGAPHVHEQAPTAVQHQLHAPYHVHVLAVVLERARKLAYPRRPLRHHDVGRADVAAMAAERRHERATCRAQLLASCCQLQGHQLPAGKWQRVCMGARFWGFTAYRASMHVWQSSLLVEGGWEVGKEGEVYRLHLCSVRMAVQANFGLCC